MSALIIVAALAAQTAAPTTSPPTSTASEGPAVGTSTYVDLEGGAGYSTNPDFSLGDNTGSGFWRISAHAVHTRISTRTTTVLSGFAQNIFYTNHYGAQQSFDLNGRHDARVSEKLRVFGDADLSYDKGGQLDTRIIGVPNVPFPPGTVQPPILIPPGGDFISVTGRQYSASGHIGAQYALSPREFLTMNTGLEHEVFKSGSFDTRYTAIPVSLGYERQISPQTTVGARLAARFTDYDGPTTVRVITPQLTIQTALSQRMSFSGAVGASFASTDDGISTRHSTGLAANANLCSTGEHDQLCARATIDQQASTLAGPAKTITAGVDYSRRLDADQTIRFSLNGSHYSTPTSVVVGQPFSNSTYLRGAADYTRRLSDRWFGGVDVAARKITRDGPDPKADISGSLFIRYRLGDLR
jgi:hypothetical protein